jgi:hypothetical protein
MVLAFALLLQRPALVVLSRPELVLAAPFSQIVGAHELPDGRLILTDRLEDRLLIADLATGKLVTIGRAGAGPEEFRRPGRLVPVNGDSILLADEGNERLLVIGPDLRIHRTFRLEVPGVATDLWPRGVDAMGRYYVQVPRWAAQGGPYAGHGDSLAVLRSTGSGMRPEIVTWVVALADPPGQVRHGLPYVPFSPQDGWTVDPSGVVVVVRAGDYHVERLGAARVRRGAPVPYAPLPVTMADKRAYMRTFLENSGMGGRGATGGSAIGNVPAEMMTEESITRLVATNPYAARKPPITDRAPILAPDGTLWVERSGTLEAPTTYDLFDGTGAVVQKVTLPAGRRLLLVGRAGIYLVATDEDGVERVERYRIQRQDAAQ